MRARTSRRLALLLALGAIASVSLVTTGASASHGSDSAGWIAQAGGLGGTNDPVLENFSVRTVLFDNRRFVASAGEPRPMFTKYTGWGVVDTPAGGHLMTSRSDDGQRWADPIPNFIRNPDSGETVPFLLNDNFADVVFKNAPLRPASFDDYPFAIYWRAGQVDDPVGISTIHRAVSEDGIIWEAETPIGQSSDFEPDPDPRPPQFGGGGKPLLGAPLAQTQTYGPTDVIYNPSGSTAARCGSSNPQAVNVWSCRWVMIYDAVDTRHNLRIAGSHNGLLWYGTDDPILTPGAGAAWDNAGVTLGHLRPGSFTLYYSGTDTAPNACVAGDSACWSIGVATSINGITFTKAPTNPATPRELLDIFASDDPGTLWNAQALSDGALNGGGHHRIYYSRISNGNLADEIAPQADMYAAFTSPAPGLGPQIYIDQPVGPFRNRPDTPVAFHVTDTLGTTIGVDLTTLDVKIDGTTVLGWSVEPTRLLGALKYPSFRVSIPSGLNILADGIHTFSVSVDDLDGVNSFASTSFIVDTTAPTTTVLTGPADGQFGFPFGYPGTFTGTTVEPATGTALSRLNAHVTNPLGQTKVYGIQIQLEFIVSPKEWDWTWHAPPSDLHFALPGSYTFEFRAEDIAQNGEGPTTANTHTVVII